jgi:hypothetical protein
MVIAAWALRPVSGRPPGPWIGRQAAQRLARSELSKAVYHPHRSFTQWLLGEIGNLLSRLLAAGAAAVPGGWWTLAALAVAGVGVVATILTRVGPLTRSRRRVPGALSGTAPLTAREHRQRAERLAAGGDHSAAILEYLRAIAADLEEQGILVPDPGRTADELSGEAGRLLPAHAAGLASAARLFDDVCYGGRDGTREGYEQLRDLDAAIREPMGTPRRLAIPT